MIYPQIDAQLWAETYSLSTEKVDCPNCGIEQTLKNPVAFDHWRGLEADLHECGPRYQASVFKTVDRETIQIWNQLQLKLR